MARQAARPVDNRVRWTIEAGSGYTPPALSAGGVRVLAGAMRPAVIARLFDTIAPWYTERHGGYTRIVRIGRRLGDAGETAYLELVKSVEQREQERTDRITAEEAKEKALKASEASPKKKKAAEESAGAETERPKRGSRKEGDKSMPARRRGRTGVKTG